MKKTCPNCGKEFIANSPNRIYCCRKCGDQYRRKGHHANYPPTVFVCRNCGSTVRTEGGTDKRTVFCSHDCEKQYWRHPPEAKRSQIRNYCSASQYASWEKWSNKHINTGR